MFFLFTNQLKRKRPRPDNGRGLLGSSNQQPLTAQLFTVNY